MKTPSRTITAALALTSRAFDSSLQYALTKAHL